MTGSIVYNIIKEAGLLVPGLKSPPLFQSLYRKDEEPVAKPVIYKKLSTEKTWFFRLVP